MRRWLLFALLGITTACGGSSSGADGAAKTPAPGVDDDGGPAAEQEVPVTPLEKGPPQLTEAEQKELSGTCFPMENDLYEAGKQGLLVLDTELAGGKDDAAAEQAGLDAARAALEGKGGDLGGARDACVAVFTKQMKRRLFDYEPAEKPARETLDACVKRAVAAFGKASQTFELGGQAGPSVNQGPFCPDDFPVPPSLKDLPYESSAEDWESPAWTCLAFGMRIEQPFQIEYEAPYGEERFACITRFLPRHGGAPIELIRRGRVSDARELEVDKNSTRRRMKAN